MKASPTGPRGELSEKGERLEGVEHRVFHAAGVHEHLRNVFFGSFPMERFYTVAAQIPAPGGMTQQAKIGRAEMIRAAELDPFAAYSIACADWVMFPRVKSKSATWQRVTRERQVGKQMVKYQAWTLQTTFAFEVDVYRFDEQSWTLVETVQADSGLIGAALGLPSAGAAFNGVMNMFSDEADAAIPAPLSAAPELTCRVPLVDDLRDIADSYGKCGEATLAATSSASAALKLNPKDAPEKDPIAKSTPDGDEAQAAQDPPSTPGTAPDEAPDAQGTKDETTEGASDEAAKPEEPSQVAGSDPDPEATGSDADAETPPEPVLDERTREALEIASGGNPRRGIENLAKQEVGESAAAQGMVEAVAAAKVAATTCRAGVDAVVDASMKLRALATQAPMQTVRQAALGFAACAGIPLTYDLGEATPPGTEQMGSKYCRGLDERNAVARGPAAMHDVALCVGRVSGEHTTLAVQKEVKTIPGIKIEVPLLALPTPQSNRFGLAVGKTEGVRRGDMYVARDGSGVVLGFGLVVQQGPGGESGVRDPSHYRFRAGEAPVGTNMEEYPKIGLLLGARPQVGMILLKDDLASSLLVGGALEGGYNAGEFVDVGDEFWVRTNLAYLVGEERERFIVLEFVPEAQYYLFSRTAAFVQSGFGLTFGNKKIPGLVSDVDLRGLAISALLGFGLDVAVTPDWNTRLAVTGSQGINELTLKDENEVFVVEGGRLSTVQGTLSVDYTF